MVTRARLLSGLAITMAFLAACESSTEINPTKIYAGFLNGANPRPTPSSSTATGQAVVIVTPGLELSFNVTWVGLTGAPIAASIHGPADENSAAGVLVDFSKLPAGSTKQVTDFQADGSASGNMNVTPGAVVTPTVSADSLMTLMNAGLLYVCIRTATHPTGEIRAQLRKQ